ncbi:hypothetical protein SAMN05192563_105240 [Paraburkholderia aspalathi]|uniref:Uncharacterized protein n=1 Tax=Paraburkholderia aspalathi TaxID=1324617 RepID=A0A1I7ER12_9BURK|nr:hypothetical protein SAMN05192563_105240 [Paraburkholderia aspalathi]
MAVCGFPAGKRWAKLVALLQYQTTGSTQREIRFTSSQRRAPCCPNMLMFDRIISGAANRRASERGWEREFEAETAPAGWRHSPRARSGGRRERSPRRAAMFECEAAAKIGTLMNLLIAACFECQRRIVKNRVSLKLTTGVGSRCSFAIKYAPCREDTMNAASSWQLVSARSSRTSTAAARQ